MTQPGLPLGTRMTEFLDAVAGESPATAAGTVAATVTAMAAGLVSMSAHRSKDAWTDAGGAVAQADILRNRASTLITRSGPAYEQAVASLAGRGEDDGRSAEQRDWQLGTSLRKSVEAPLSCAEIAADIAELSAEVARHCDPASRAEAVAGGQLAEAAALIGAHLVEINLAVGGDPELRSKADLAVQRAAAGRARAAAAD